MESTVHAHMDTCDFKREQVIRSDNVWLSEVMLGKRCGARVHWVPRGRFQDSKRDFLWAQAGGITPQQSASIHKIFTRIPQESPMIFTRISQVHSTENNRNNFRSSCENTRIRMSHWENTWTTRNQLLDQWNKGIIACSPLGDTRNSYVNMRDSRETKG